MRNQDSVRGSAAEDFGVYLHVPYCRRRCPYCDFALTPLGAGAAPSAAWADAALAEIARAATALEVAGHPVSARFAGRRAGSVFFGGGTPSLLDPADIARVIAAIDRRWPLADNAEVTLEANPEDAGGSRFAGFRAAGVNRLSLGVQSFDDRVLRALGREHDGAQAARAVALAHAAGFAQVGVDLVFGAAGLTSALWEETLERAIALGPTHVSCYGLTLERGTALTRAVAKGAITLPGDDAQADQYEAAVERLSAAGLPRYEISNFAAPDDRSRHNLLYWRYREWLGIGPSAHSFARIGPDGSPEAGGLRWWNGRNPFRYVRERLPDAGGHEVITGRRAMGELAFTSLRLADGLDRGEFRAVFAMDADAVFGTTFARLAAAGLLAVEPARVRLTDRGFLLSDAVFASLV